LKLRFETVSIANLEDQDARLVFADDRLVAVLSRLSKAQGERAGHWFTEALFGPISLRDRDQATFTDLGEVQHWFERQLGERSD
jgi:hypothetical protein